LLLLLLVVYGIQYAIDICYQKRVNNKFAKLLRHEIDNNVMIFGSSVAYHQFDPQIIKDVTGHSAYNMGFPGMFFAQYNGLIQEYQLYQKQCKAIVIACDFDNLGKNELATRPDLFYAYINNCNIYSSLYEMEQRKAFMAKYVPGYKLTLLNKAFYTDILLSKQYKDTANGYEALTTAWEVTKHKPFNSRYEEAIFVQFKNAVDEITQKGIKVVLVIPPVYKEGYKLILNAEAIKSKYRSLVNKNVHFLDYTNDTLCRTQDNFRNFTHLNANGASKFSHTFAQDLLKIIHE
jgi:hypothetical protein